MTTTVNLKRTVPGRVTVHTPDDIRRDLKASIPGLLRIDLKVTRDHVVHLDRAAVDRFGGDLGLLALTFTCGGSVFGSGPGRRGRIGVIAEPLPGTNRSYLETCSGRARFADRLREALQGLTASDYDLGDGSFSRFRLTLHAAMVAVAVQLRGNFRPSVESVIRDVSPQSSGRVRVFRIPERGGTGGQEAAGAVGRGPASVGERLTVVTVADFEARSFPLGPTRPPTASPVPATISLGESLDHEKGRRRGGRGFASGLSAPRQHPSSRTSDGRRSARRASRAPPWRAPNPRPPPATRTSGLGSPTTIRKAAATATLTTDSTYRRGGKRAEAEPGKSEGPPLWGGPSAFPLRR